MPLQAVLSEYCLFSFVLDLLLTNGLNICFSPHSHI
jgi:hypothetical protein